MVTKTERSLEWESGPLQQCLEHLDPHGPLVLARSVFDN